jgi:hypothetical protein
MSSRKKLQVCNRSGWRKFGNSVAFASALLYYQPIKLEINYVMSKFKRTANSRLRCRGLLRRFDCVPPHRLALRVVTLLRTSGSQWLLLSPIRIPISLVLQIEIPVYMLRFTEFVGAFDARFTRATGIFHPAKGTCVIIGQRVVDPGCTCFIRILHQSFAAKIHLREYPTRRR